MIRNVQAEYADLQLCYGCQISGVFFNHSPGCSSSTYPIYIAAGCQYLWCFHRNRTELPINLSGAPCVVPVAIVKHSRDQSSSNITSAVRIRRESLLIKLECKRLSARITRARLTVSPDASQAGSSSPSTRGTGQPLLCLASEGGVVFLKAVSAGLLWAQGFVMKSACAVWAIRLSSVERFKSKISTWRNIFTKGKSFWRCFLRSIVD